MIVGSLIQYRSTHLTHSALVLCNPTQNCRRGRSNGIGCSGLDVSWDCASDKRMRIGVEPASQRGGGLESF